MLENPSSVVSTSTGLDLSCLDQRWVLGPQIGKDTSANFALSFDGLAIRTLDNRFVVPQLDAGRVKLIDVTCLTIAADPLVFRVPVTIDAVQPGDILVRSDSPFSLLVVETPPADNRIVGIDPRTDETVEILIADRTLDIPTLLVRIVSLFQGIEAYGDAGEDRGGRVGGGAGGLGSLLPFLLLSGAGGTGGSANNALLAFALASSRTIDPMMALLLSGGAQTNSLAQTLVLLSLSGRQNVFGGRRGRARRQEAAAVAQEEAAVADEEPARRGGRQTRARRKRTRRG